MSRIVLIHGNCQGQMLNRVMSEISGWPDDLEFREVVSFENPIRGWDVVTDDEMRRVVAMWSQFDERENFPHRDDLYARLPAGVKPIIFPNFDFLSLWPFAGVDPRNVPEIPDYPFGRFPWSDFIGAAIAKMNISDEQIYPTYLELTAKKMPNLDVRLERDISRWRQRDAGCDVKVTDYILENFRSKRLFWTMSHVAGPTTVYTAQRLYELSADALGGDRSHVAREFARLMAEFQGADDEQVPIHPEVARHFKLEYYDPEATYRHHSAWVTAEEYIRKYVKWEALW
ncbi:MAG TPA: WcbI family polysaccharide biosynthesis putative acetyltransferase [Methylocystis sp.]|nr:WcbI family polysaccharide biosynthesis putative acetyltransferase [Methylocystis sp.]